MSIIPVRIGFRYHFYKSMYVEPQVGYSKVQFEKKYFPRFQAYNYAVNLGILKRKHLISPRKNQGFKSRNITTNSTTTQYRFSSLSYGQNLHSPGIRVGYNFNLKR